MHGNSCGHQGRCKCPQCKNQLDLQLHSKKPLASIYLYRHLKKRQGPPDKKDYNKDGAQKSKPPKTELESKAATPVKHKADRSKEANPAVLPPEYHMVSHSQRTKLVKESHFESRRDDRLWPKLRPNQEPVRLEEISQNPENMKAMTRHLTPSQRTRVDASPHGGNLGKMETSQSRKPQ